MKSLLRSDPGLTCCYVCGTEYGLHEHHVFYGSGDRKQSEKYGCKVKLCGPHHNLSGAGVHFNPLLDTELKQKFQRLFMAEYGPMEYMRIFGRNYID